MTDRLYLVDTFSLVFQVYHAIPPMTSPSGQPTNAVYGFTRDLLNILRSHQPTHVICAMDSPGPGVRNELFAEYKANRSEMPEDLKPQIPLVLEIMAAFGTPAVRHDGWEADDVIATLTRRACDEGFEVRIVTNDKDARQLIGPSVQLYNVRKDAFADELFLEKDWGIRPDQVIDFQSLVGDSVDNIPGVPLVGPKKAAALLNQFKTLEQVLEHADEAPGAKLRQNLKEYADQARLSRKLVTLNTDLPLEIDWESACIGNVDHERLRTLFRDLGFQRLADDVREFLGQSLESADTGERSPTQGSLFGDDERTWETIDTEPMFREFLDALKGQKRFCLDLETTGLEELRADIVGWAFSWQAGTGYYVPVQGPPGQQVLNPNTVRESLRPILEDPAVEVTNQNIKYDMLVLRRAGIRLRNVGMDPMVGSYLLNAGARSHSLDTLAEVYLNHRMIPIRDLIGSGKTQKKMFEVDVARVAEYASEDADVSWQVAKIIGDELRREELWDLYWNLERPLISVLTDMEFNGVRVDVDELQRQSREITDRLEDLIREIHTEAGHEFNIDSPKQLATVLFDELNLPVQKKTKTGASTDQSVLEKLAPLHSLPAKIMEHRHLAKLKGTYLDALPELVNPETGKIHTSFHQAVTATGRLSSKDPNLQNIPIRTEEGRRVRRAFIPSQTDWVLICADYSQIELRMLAHLSGDPVLCDAFANDADIHAAVAAEVFGVSMDQVNSDMRRVAKAVNFGVIYGQSSFGLSGAIGISQTEAAKFIEDYFARYSGVTQFLDKLLRNCRRSGYAKTILGRRRPIQGIRPSPNLQRNMAERTAINTVIQGSAADLIKQAMINVHERIERDQLPARMLLQIHDELIFEVPQDNADEFVSVVRPEMESALDLTVPLKTDISIGENWLDRRRI